MKLKSTCRIIFSALIVKLAFTDNLYAQKDSAGYIKVAASGKYIKGKAYQKNWGAHYRDVWSTPVNFRIAMLDTLAGGLTPYELGGGRQSISLRLRDKNNREYVLRSIDKSFGKSLPEIVKGTFIEKIADDQTSIGHPYAALAVAPLAEAAGIYHTNPVIYYIPKQPALGIFNDSIGDNLYLFEQRPDANWESAPNFGNSKKISGTYKMLENTLQDNNVSVDQELYVRSRLFDMLIGDWGRHEDQWRWAVIEKGDQIIYRPVPRDRDQAFTKFDGKYTKIARSVAGLKHLQSFDNDIDDMEYYNFPARNLDFHLTNEITLEKWKQIAADLQLRITDKVIENAMMQFPDEVRGIASDNISSILRARRSHLQEFAEEYYFLLAEEAEITGSMKSEKFIVKRLPNATSVEVYKINEDASVASKPVYSRIFNDAHTDELRIYGIGGEDVFEVTGRVKSGIKLRLIGGNGKDKFIDESSVAKGGHRTKIYDNRNNEFIKSGETALRLSSDSAIHAYKYDNFQYDKKSILPVFFYSFEDRFYVGLRYTYQKHQWRKEPYGFRHYAAVRYSLGQKAFSLTYENRFPQLAGKWDLVTNINYDFIRWTNFYGLGNETKMITDNRDYYRLRTKEFTGGIGLERIIRNRHRITFLPFIQTTAVVIDTARFVAKTNSFQQDAGYNNTQKFGGVTLQYVYQHINDSIFPTKGIAFSITGGYTRNLKHSENSFGRYEGVLRIYIPVTKSLSFAINTAASTLNGRPQFYQYNRIGGTRTLRGYERDRFHAKSTFYEQNELRLIKDVRSFLYNGKFGIFAFYDIGRVWQDHENSDKLHQGYGGGIIISPFNKISASAGYGISKDDKQLHLTLIRVL